MLCLLSIKFTQLLCKRLVTASSERNNDYEMQSLTHTPANETLTASLGCVLGPARQKWLLRHSSWCRRHKSPLQICPREICVTCSESSPEHIFFKVPERLTLLCSTALQDGLGSHEIMEVSVTYITSLWLTKWDVFPNCNFCLMPTLKWDESLFSLAIYGN